MRVLREVLVHRTPQGEFLVVSNAAAVIGEEMSLDLVGSGANRELRVRVLDSRPVIVEGALRHRILLAPVTEGIAQAETADVPVPGRAIVAAQSAVEPA
jgi:hypothetical protein